MSFSNWGFIYLGVGEEDLEEIYELRCLLEERAAHAALPRIDEDAIARIAGAAKDCANAAEVTDVVAELAANCRFHFSLFEAADQPHLMRLIRMLWDSTDAYRAMYYNAPTERQASLDAHDRIIAAIEARDAVQLVVEQDAHRERALRAMRVILDKH